MPFLGEISSVQPSMQIHLGILRAQSIIDGKALASSFIFRSGKRLFSSWKPLNLPLKQHRNVESFKIQRGRVFITAVATFETESSVQKQDGNKGSPMQIESANKDSEEMDEKERLRRMRISKANKGTTPWNKGRKHSPETRQRIRERTKIAMQNSKVKKKLANYAGHAQSEETKEKIAAALKRRWERHREALMLQESCHFEWQNLIAEAARTGFAGEDELQWDSYEILREQMEGEWVESVEQRKGTKPKGCTRAPKSLEQRRKISAAITAKWTNPEYRERISSTKSRNRAAKVGVERKPRIIKQSKKNTNGSKTRGSKEHNAKYKDPLTSSKLKMIKNIRAQRKAAETRKTEAIERARALIAEAEMAMNALELAPEKSPNAQASLVETRNIIAEAIRSLESLKTRQAINEGNGEEHELMNQTLLASSEGENIVLNDGKEFVSSRSNGDHSPPQVNVEDGMKQSGTSQTEQPSPDVNAMFEKNTPPNGAPPKPSIKTKKWVRGRLVEVSEVEDWSLSEEVEDWESDEEDEGH